MKCIKCNTENNLKDRKNANGKCKSCRHEFAFDPKVMSGVDFTDKFFQQTLHNISVNDSLYFTKRQLYYFFNQRRNIKQADRLKAAAGCALAASFIIGTILLLSVGFWFLWFLLLMIIFVALRQRLRGRVRRELTASPDQVEGWYRRWSRINGEAAKLLPLPTQSGDAQKTAISINPELKNYSFDRAVICDRAEIAQCLIANNFHFENNAAVLSLDGYPHDIFETVMDMLRRNPTLTVYALHDASIRGVSLPHTLSAEPRWFAGSNIKIFDLGLLPRQILKRSVFVESQPPRATIPEPVKAALRPDEVAWLNAGNHVSLESFPPQTLLRVITQGIAKSRDPQAADSLAPVTTSGGDGAFYFYAWDSFG